MSIYRMWLIGKEFKKIDDWLIPAENSLSYDEALKKVELYDEAFVKADTTFMNKISSPWLFICVYIKYAIVFMLLFSFIRGSIYNSDVALLFSFIIILIYRKMDINQVFNRYRDMQIQVLLAKTRLLRDAIEKNIKKTEKLNKKLSEEKDFGDEF